MHSDLKMMASPRHSYPRREEQTSLQHKCVFRMSDWILHVSVGMIGEATVVALCPAPSQGHLIDLWPPANSGRHFALRGKPMAAAPLPRLIAIQAHE
jgi:hypothetical protein